jgi:hypothetical protein
MNMLDNDFALDSFEPLSISAEPDVSLSITTISTQAKLTAPDEVTALLKNLELRRRQNRAKIMVKGDPYHKSEKKTTLSLRKSIKNPQKLKSKSKT